MTYGVRNRHGYSKGYHYPTATPQAPRRDAWPPGGGQPASHLPFMQQQHLDHYGIEFAVMNPLTPTGQGDQNPQFSAALAFATNEWQLAAFVPRHPRPKASIIVPYEDSEASRVEIRRRAGDRHFAHIFLLSRT